MTLRRTVALTLGIGVTLAGTAGAQPGGGHLLVAQPGGQAATRYHDVLPWQPMDRPRRLADGQRLKCGEPCRVEVDDGSSVELSAGTIVAASSPLFFRFGPGELARRSPVLVLLAGKIEVKRPPQAQAPLVVQLPSGQQLATKCSRTRIRVLDSGVVVAPDEPGVSLRQGDHWQALVPDLAHRVTATEVVSRPLLAPPDWDLTDSEATRPVALVTSEGTGMVAGSWHDLPGAVRYHVEIADDSGFARVVNRLALDAPAHGFRLPMPAGSFHVRVVAEDAEGLESSPSPPLPLRIIRADLPPGGFVADDSTLVLPEGRPLHLPAADGLELSIGLSGFWKAPSEIAGPAEERRRLRFRVAGDARTTTEFGLERRALEALVTMSPSAPIWPQDKLKLTVRLVDRSGRVDVRGVEPTIEVKLSGSSIPVTWFKGEANAVWNADVAPRHLDGPSLMEVVARDAAGVPIGWGFVELVAGLGEESH